MHRSTTAAILATVLAVTALAGSVGAAQQQSYALEQGGACTELAPLSGEALAGEDLTVEEFYGYTADASGEGVQYSANTPIGLEERNDDNSSLFLYEGSDGLSLVVLHDGVNGTGGGAATMTFDGLPTDGEWVVRDDPENESDERWNRTTDGGAAVDWAWRGAYTDGGAFQGGLDGDFEIRIVPQFGDDATLDPITPGEVTRWRALSADGDSLEAVELDLDEPITIRSGSCS